MNPGSRSAWWMLVAGGFFACMGALVKLGAATFTSAELVFYRSLFGLLTLLGIAYFGRKPLATQQWKPHLWRSLSGFAALILFFHAISQLPLATAVTLNYTSPLFLALLTFIFLRNEAKPMLLLSIIIGFCGVALLLQPSFSAGAWRPALMGLCSGLLAGIAYLQVTQLGRLGEPEWRTVFYFTLVCALGSGLWMLLLPFHPPAIKDGLLLIALGACATIAQLAMTRAYREGNPLVAGSFAYSTVLIASLIGVTLLQEKLPGLSWAGIALIIVSGIASLAWAPRPPRAEPGLDKAA